MQINLSTEAQMLLVQGPGRQILETEVEILHTDNPGQKLVLKAEPAHLRQLLRQFTGPVASAA